MSIVDAPLADRDYGEKVTAVEPGGVEFIPLSERHGNPIQLLWTWSSPNFEFATVFVGILGTWAFGLTFGQATLAIVLGTALGCITHAILSAEGPSVGLPQMVAGRSAFGFVGNFLPSAVNAVAGGIGWFAVNSVSGALALAALTDLPNLLCLLIIVVVQVAVAFLGHNLVHAWERYAFPVLGLIFLIASVIIFSKADFGASTGGGGFAGFTLMTSACFGYAAGWNPYAADYTRYFAPDTSKLKTGLYAALGVFVSCVLLLLAGAAAVSVMDPDVLAANPTAAFTEVLPTAMEKLTLLAIAIGAVSANAINIYSGAISLMALEIKIPSHIARAVVALVFGVVGFFVAWSGLHDAGAKYEDFLLIIAYWIAAWLGVVLTDLYLRRGTRIEGALVTRGYTNWAGPIAFVVGAVGSVVLFSNQEKFVGAIAKHSSVGDLTPLVGFVIAAALYAVLFKPLAGTVPAAPAEIPSEA
ncbi:purine-cytosine permease family protein [Nocardioides cheoyonin]|uniref:purine-cytosine permease family protein n=1 Tax=Nocardioides cheoyonin TaxID=3156615 RepID=UPI0032B4BF88